MLKFRLKKFMLVRLFFGALLLYEPLVFPATATDYVFYGGSVFVCFSSVFYLLWYLTSRWLRGLALTQIFVDVLLETYLVFYTGGPESLFAIFYVLTILSAALVLGEKKTILQTTVLSSVAYFLGSLGAYLLKIHLLGPRDPLYFFYGTSVRIVIFFTVGSLSRHLSGALLELENRLKLAERLSSLGEVASKIAHEIRNPLSAIRTAAEVIKDSLSGKLGPQEEKMMAIVESESERLTQTLQRILDYAKQIPPAPKMLLVDHLIERTLALVRLPSRLNSDGVVVEKKYDPVRTHVYADEEQILSAFLNLMLNAYQAMPEGGIFKISAEEALGGTRIDFEDTGGGIPREKLRDLFLPFRSSKKGGTGLGLAEVHKIVTLHGGKIEVETQPGRGTSFHLYFPKS